MANPGGWWQTQRFSSKGDPAAPESAGFTFDPAYTFPLDPAGPPGWLTALSAGGETTFHRSTHPDGDRRQDSAAPVVVAGAAGMTSFSLGAWSSAPVTYDPVPGDTVPPPADDTPPAEAAPGTGRTWSIGQQVVFIDGTVSDVAVLMAGLNPNVLAVILPDETDGVVAIADWLSDHDVHDLASIAIVSHGAEGVLLLGSAALEATTLDRYESELARIGAALADDGDLLLYSCDVGRNDAGAAFVELIAAATGADVAAASHMIGSAGGGGTFLLDVNFGQVEAGTPFTALAQAAFTDELATAVNQLYYTTTGASSGSSANRVAQIGVNGTATVGSPTTLRDASQEAGWINVPSITVDPAAGKFFIVNSNAGTAASILSGTINTASALTSLVSYAANTYRIGDVTIDQPNQDLYYTLFPTQLATPAADVGVWKMKENGTGVTQVIGGYTSVSATTIPNAVALDLANSLVWFSEGANVGASSRLLFGNVVSGTKSAAVITHATGTLIRDILVHNGTLYYSTANGGAVGGNNIFAVPYTVTGTGASATATIGTVSTLYAGANAGNPVSIAIDPVTGRLYSAGASVISPSIPDVAINVGTITGGGAMQTIFTQDNGTSAINGAGLFFESTPTVTATGTVTHAVGGSAVTIAAGAGVVSPSGFTLKSATVAITGGNFVNDGDTLTAVTAGTSISAVFSGDTLTLSGIDTAAHYQQVLKSVTYKSTAGDPTNGGANTTRTVTWTVNDGVILSSSPTTTIKLQGLPTVVAGGTVSFSGGGSPVTLASGLTVTDPFSATLVGATIVVGGLVSGDVLNFVNQGGIIGNYVAGTGTLTLAGTSALATYQTALRSVTYSFNPGNGDPTNGGSATSRTISWTVNDGAASSALVTSALNVVHVAPTITTSGTVTFGTGHPNPALDPTLTVTAPNSFGLLHGATVTITGGNFLGESDVLTATTLGTSISFVYNPSLNIGTLSGSDTVANYQAVLRSVTISSGIIDPTNGGANPTRTIAWVVNDGVLNSATSNSFAEAAVCFAEGTGIATPRGDVAVEALRPGDPILTHPGAERRIKWVGQRQIDLARLGHPRHLQPIRILAGAFAPGIPARDLRLSPAHAVLLDGVLVPVELLINGASIIRDTACRTVTYHHVELDTHDVLLSEGLATETYLDTGNRTFFANAEGPVQLHPHLGLVTRTDASCAPFAIDPATVEPLWHRLRARTAALGPRVPDRNDTTRDPDLHVMVSGRRLNPVSRADGRYVFILPASDQPVMLVSRSAVPSDARPWLGDHRALGVMMARLTRRGLDGARHPIPLDHADLNIGWWAPERHGKDTLRRWTTGRAVLPPHPGPSVLEIEIGATLDYALEAAVRRLAA